MSHVKPLIPTLWVEGYYFEVRRLMEPTGGSPLFPLVQSDFFYMIVLFLRAPKPYITEHNTRSIGRLHIKLALHIRSTRAGESVVSAVSSATPANRLEVPTFRGPDNTLYRGPSLVYRTSSERRKNLLPGLLFLY